MKSPDEPLPREVQVPTGVTEGEAKVMGSRFLACVSPARDPDQARAFREELRRRFHDASHHVLGARFLAHADLADDDGEPAGTGGRPCVAALRSADLVQAAVVVTRYFGGTKLGTGRLGRAYEVAARAALSDAPVARMRPGREVRVEYDYGDTGSVMRVLEAEGVLRLRESYGSRAELRLGAPADAVDRLRSELRDATAGRAHCSLEGELLLLPVTGSRGADG